MSSKLFQPCVGRYAQKSWLNRISTKMWHGGSEGGNTYHNWQQVPLEVVREMMIKVVGKAFCNSRGDQQTDGARFVCLNYDLSAALSQATNARWVFYFRFCCGGGGVSNAAAVGIPELACAGAVYDRQAPTADNGER